MQFQSCCYLTPAVHTSCFPALIRAVAEWATLASWIQKKINQKSKEIPIQSKYNLKAHTLPKIATPGTSKCFTYKAFLKAWDKRCGNAACSSDLRVIPTGRDLRQSSYSNFCWKQINLSMRWQYIICLLSGAVKIKWLVEVKEEVNEA